MILSNYIDKKIKYLAKILMWFSKNSMYILCIHKLESELISYKNIRLIFMFIIKMFIIGSGIAMINCVNKFIYSIKNKSLKKADI